MLKKIILYGLILGAGTFLLKIIEYKFLVLDHSLEIYGGLVALLFMAVGIWAGLKLTRKKEKIVEIEKEVIVEKEIIREKEVVVEKQIFIDRTLPFAVNEKELEQRGISKREYEVLALMAKGHSNQEVADQLFISLSTVKTHTSNLFQKLGAERRTQAIQSAKSLGLIP
jgi:two-component system, NarL family, response regulator LiaR